MPALLLVLLPILKSAVSGLWAIANSPLGRLCIAGALAYGYGRHQANQACAAREAAAQAELARAYRAEVDRQRAAAEEIARDATERAAQDALVARAMQAKIDEYATQEIARNVQTSSPISPAGRAAPRTPVPPRRCIVDSDMARSVRELDAAAHRPPGPPRRAR